MNYTQYVFETDDCIWHVIAFIPNSKNGEDPVPVITGIYKNFVLVDISEAAVIKNKIANGALRKHSFIPLSPK